MAGTNTGIYRDVKNRRRCVLCGKLAFSDEERAFNIANRAARRDKYLRVYYDPACGYWHLSSQPQRIADSWGDIMTNMPEAQKIKREGWFPSLVFFLLVIAVVWGLVELLN